MRKRRLTVVALAAMMALGTATITSMAAAGWAQENNQWVYYTSSGYKITDAWKEGADGYWRYLGSDGCMVVDSWVDDNNYYVDSNGIMVKSNWLQVDDGEGGYEWYYFNATGKCVKERWEKINGQYYYFDDEGQMQTGWILEDRYYCNENGQMVTGWQKLLPPEEEEDDDDSTGPYDTVSDGTYWYYFNTNGKKVVPDTDGDGAFKQKRINGVYYVLREDGAMQTGWVCATGEESDDIADYRFVDENGQVRTGWYSTTPPEELEERYSHDVEWFYFNSKGVPRTGPEDGDASTSDFVKINGNTYLFDENGVPVYGVKKIYTDSDQSDYTAYYFGTRAQSAMIKGKKTLDEGGDQVGYYFTTSGRGYTGVHDSVLYYMGRAQKAEDGNKYEVITVDGSNYLVNGSGRIVKNRKVKDSDGTEYRTNSGGVVLTMDGVDVDDKVFNSPTEPDWNALADYAD